ncbi:MAG: hypothetical protein A3C84_03700 [Candidatus Ryanbacteria bacterium RIFCSPHIGHO2_02_FULL_48_12]|uniref:Adenine DNA glycosylase n=1 Tax=Candidatus Ryanbacteria bacterium RIFCSPHIGHO2_01_FULL_48_27 TaxID=1802115 RepID=A0A1G2G6I9_9BACT|nr:MAG: hypothetical protein A2756_03070 [Candidatus Ryanbacteria bacterium RIFCSPHIGHO2_01_FULL_48_27]OGZ49445.1 MAG: hypothetical protein A3C84_03700 [Candidatus Ryanbacteria bacterium RIFCSPHIGHO2_02_FULL_48_12]
MNREKIKVFQKSIRTWYRHHAPNLPWRTTKNPWHVLVSEVMLQQTQIPRVLKKYPEFLRRFPTPQALAKAPWGTVLNSWQGMGYNRRAKYLQNAAHIISTEHHGIVPQGTETLDALPGIGPYSARAIACFAYNRCEPFIETNIRRTVIHTFFSHKKNIPDVAILLVLKKIEPRTKNREWYLALMDYGRDAIKNVPNPNRKSKHYTRQSRFAGSDRYIRGKIIQLLIANGNLPLKRVHQELHEDPHLSKLTAPKTKNILASLLKENIIRQEDHKYSID